MQLEEEAHVWQTIGIIAWAAGAGMLLVLFKQNGVIKVSDPATLSNGLAASFMMLAGIAGTVFGRVMNALIDGYQPREARLWHLFALVCSSCGAFAVLYIALGHWNKPVSLTALTVGLAGSFLIVTGVICLLGNRVMHRATQKLGASSGAPQAAKPAGS